MDLRERVARAMAISDGKDPDQPAWVKDYPGPQEFGICWRDHYADKADAAIAICMAEAAKVAREYGRTSVGDLTENICCVESSREISAAILALAAPQPQS